VLLDFQALLKEDEIRVLTSRTVSITQVTAGWFETCAYVIDVDISLGLEMYPSPECSRYQMARQ